MSRRSPPWPHSLPEPPGPAQTPPQEPRAGAVAWSHPADGDGYRAAMDLAYPHEAEEFRVEIARWLEENLPDGWGEPGFSMTPEQRKAFNKEWTAKLYGGGWICASWPAEYGGKGLSLLQQVVLNEEFARAGAPLRADFFGDTLVGPTILQWGTEEQKRQFIPGILQGGDLVVPGLLRARRGLGPGEPQDHGRARRRRVGHQRPEGVDDPGAVRRLRLPARAHRPRRRPSTPASATSSCPCSQHGVEVRPISQVDGSAEFNEVFFTNARCPKDNVVGGVNNGWKVAMTTLGFERGSSSTTGYRRFLKECDEILALARRLGQTDDPLVRDALVAVVVEDQDHGDQRLPVAHRRASTAPTRRGCSAPATRCSGPRRTARRCSSAMDILGMEGQILLGRRRRGHPAARVRAGAKANYPVNNLQSLFFFSRSETIWGGAGGDPAQHRGRARARPAQGASAAVAGAGQTLAVWRSGSSTLNAAPPPGASSTQARPPWISANLRTTKSPRPRPPTVLFARR